MSSADHIIFGLYPTALIEWFRTYGHLLKPGCIFTDVSGVKTGLVEPVQALSLIHISSMAAMRSLSFRRKRSALRMTVVPSHSRPSTMSTGPRLSLIHISHIGPGREGQAKACAHLLGQRIQLLRWRRSS